MKTTLYKMFKLLVSPALNVHENVKTGLCGCTINTFRLDPVTCLFSPYANSRATTEMDEANIVSLELWWSSLPAEVKQRPTGLRDVLVEPGQKVELSDGPRLVGLHVLKVEATNQEVITPDVLRHQVDLQVDADLQLSNTFRHSGTKHC